ncbi:MAG TPA: hypothetical protein VN414_13485 [Methanosarcina sp.]|nr:hypothetical protein [Methanosarcina sp.]
MSVIDEHIVDQSKYIVDVALKLRNLDLEIAKNPNCYELKSRRFKVLEDLHDKTRAEMVQAAAELRRSKDREGIRCADCMRCDLYKEFI